MSETCVESLTNVSDPGKNLDLLRHQPIFRGQKAYRIKVFRDPNPSPKSTFDLKELQKDFILINYILKSTLATKMTKMLQLMSKFLEVADIVYRNHRHPTAPMERPPKGKNTGVFCRSTL